MAIKRHILRKLYNRRIIGARHTAAENCLAGIPPQLKKQAKKTLEELIKQELIIAKRTSYGLQVSLNHEKLLEIKEIICSER